MKKEHFIFLYHVGCFPIKEDHCMTHTEDLRAYGICCNIAWIAFGKKNLIWKWAGLQPHLLAVSTLDTHIPQLLSCEVIQLAFFTHSRYFCVANFLAWNSSCLPIKISSTEFWHLETNRKTLDRQLILISSHLELQLQLSFKDVYPAHKQEDTSSQK